MSSLGVVRTVSHVSCADSEQWAKTSRRKIYHTISSTTTLHVHFLGVSSLDYLCSNISAKDVFSSSPRVITRYFGGTCLKVTSVLLPACLPCSRQDTKKSLLRF